MNLPVGILATTVNLFVLVKDVNDPYPQALLHLRKKIMVRNRPIKTKAIFAIKQNSRERNLLTFFLISLLFYKSRLLIN